MNQLAITEKHSVALDLARWLSTEYGLPLERMGDYFQVGDVRVSWLVGHVLENAQPHDYDPRYKKWSQADLPIIPSPFKLLPKENMGPRIAALRKLLSEADEVIGCADPDQEGQLLQDEFLLWAGWKGPTYRLWLSSMDDEFVREEWRLRRPNTEREGMYWSALARSEADWLVGINFSRAATKSSEANGGSATLSVGRVQTPVLALVVERELAIRIFKPKSFFTPFLQLATKPGFKAAWNPDKEKDVRLDSDGRLVSEMVAKSVVAKCRGFGKATVTRVQTKKEVERTPMPFSLGSLQSHIFKKYKIKVADTLELAQSLYEKKLTTYPRTDCEFLPEPQFLKAASILSAIKRVLPEFETAVLGADPKIQSRAFNNKKVSAHFGIIPLTLDAAKVEALSANERKVLVEVVKRYILLFYPDAQFNSSEIELTCEDESFRATGKAYTLRGWKDAFKEEADEEEESSSKAKVVLPVVTKGDVLSIADVGYDSGSTKAPKRYDEDTLLTAMKNVHRMVEDPALREKLRENIGIGTSATQASIIQELLRRGFIVTNRKKELEPSEIGESLIAALPRDITKPDMTAVWQQAMDDIIEEGEKGYKAFMSAQKEWITKVVHDMPTLFAGKAMVKPGEKLRTVLETRESEHKCFTCKSELKEVNGRFGWFFGCQNKECKAIFKSEGGKPVAPKPVEVVEAGGHRTGDACPNCKKGTLRTQVCGPKSKAPGKKFLSCSMFAAEGKLKCSHTIWPS